MARLQFWVDNMERYRIAVLLLILLCCGCGGGGVTYSPVPGPAMGKNLKILTLNLCADWHSPRQDRLQAVVNFVQSNGVDVLLVQEAVQGVGQGDAVKFLADKLGYSSCQVPAFGYPVFYNFDIGVISRFPITGSKTPGCQTGDGDAVDKVFNPGSSRALMVQIGGIWFVTCHLTTPFTQAHHEQQVSCILASLPAGEVFWGGDFNSGADNAAYGLITGAGFREASIPQGGVDMVFYRGQQWTLRSSTLVLTDGYVTDHPGGVLAVYSM